MIKNDLTKINKSNELESLIKIVIRIDNRIYEKRFEKKKTRILYYIIFIRQIHKKRRYESQNTIYLNVTCL